MFYPKQTEKIHSKLSQSEAAARIQLSIEPGLLTDDDERKKWFDGRCEDDAFEMHLKLKRPNNYIPVISGIVEPDDDGGTIILVRYGLFPSSKKFLVFWTIITLLITLFFAIPYHAYLYAAISFSACLVNYIITYENFKIQVRKSSRALKYVTRK